MSGQTLNTTSYNALISAYTKAGSLPNVLETFQRMFDQARAPACRRPLPHLPWQGLRKPCLAAVHTMSWALGKSVLLPSCWLLVHV